VCAELKLRIPDDVSVISYDNISWPAAARQGLTTVTEDVSRIGRESVLMLQRIYESGVSEKEICTIPGELVIRSSL
jgi:LacI family transcriptional regulator